MNHPRIQYPPELPITAHREELIELIRGHQVLIVCGDTGSGKTTQLPKLLLEAVPRAKLIGCTQPRRLAAIAMAQRLSREFGTAPGDFVGYQHRFETSLSPETRIKFMTDGILLAETRRDPLLKRYAAIIVDEVHERSLNIDFLLGLLKRILPKRPDLKLILSSATLDAQAFSAFFGDAPVCTIPGRLFPIDCQWRPVEDEADDDLPRRIANAIDTLDREGDVLVFLPGERDILETKELLEGRHLTRTEIIPLMASLPKGEQARAFRTGPLRRIILSTNVAETSLTLPGIRAVIDSGLARIKRYSAQTHIQQLKIEPISQASARQRMGRCGRVGPGTCIRLYSEEDYTKREQQTPPEIKRSSLAGVILSMFDLNLGSIDAFPFLEPPSGAQIREGYRELIELGALEKHGEAWQVSSIGRKLNAFRIEPRYARILLAAHRQANLRDALTVVAGLCCDEPRQRPIEKQTEADRAHQVFLTANSDFTAMLNLWSWYTDAKLPQSQSARRKRCKEHFLSYSRMREWIQLREQLEESCRDLHLDCTEHRGGEGALHRALLSGLLSRIGHYDSERGDYRGMFSTRFSIFPGSGLLKKKPPKEVKRDPDAVPFSRDWVMAGELVDTSRLFARRVACIDVRWIEPLATHVCKVHHHSPFWDIDAGFVRVHEQVTLFSLLLVPKRLRDYTRINPVEAREIFIREALMTPEGLRRPPKWLQENWRRQALQRIDEDALFAFYDQHLPQNVCNQPSLKAVVLPLTERDFPIDRQRLADFPAELTVNGECVEMAYGEDDAPTCICQPSQLAALATWHAEWLVPGLLDKKLFWMLNALPNKSRRLLTPLDETVTLLRKHLEPYRRDLNDAMYKALLSVKLLRVDEAVWREEAVPEALRMNFRVIDAQGKQLAQGFNLALLVEMFSPKGHHAQPVAFDLKTFDFDLKTPEDILIEQGDGLAVTHDADLTRAKTRHHAALLKLLRLTLGNTGKTLQQGASWSKTVTAFLKSAEISAEQLGADILTIALNETFLTKGELRSMEAFRQRYAREKGRLSTVVSTWRRRFNAILESAAQLEAEASNATGILQESLDDVLDQLAWLVFDGFAATVPPEELEHYPLYLEGVDVRLQRARHNPGGDVRKLTQCQAAWMRYCDFIAKPPAHYDACALSDYRWALESLRLMLFAPELKPPVTTSLKKLDQLWSRVLP